MPQLLYDEISENKGMKDVSFFKISALGLKWQQNPIYLPVP